MGFFRALFALTWDLLRIQNQLSLRPLQSVQPFPHKRAGLVEKRADSIGYWTEISPAVLSDTHELMMPTACSGLVKSTWWGWAWKALARARRYPFSRLIFLSTITPLTVSTPSSLDKSRCRRRCCRDSPRSAGGGRALLNVLLPTCEFFLFQIGVFDVVHNAIACINDISKYI